MTDTTLRGVTPISAPISPGDDIRDEWPTHFAKWGSGGLKVVQNISGRDAITPARRPETLAIVMSDEDGYTNAYHWDGDDAKGKWVETALPGGVIIADSEGGLVKRGKTLVFGEGFSIQEAGDQEGGVLIQYTPSSDSSISVAQSWGKPATYKGVKQIQAQYPIEFIKGKDGAVALALKQGIYEEAKSPEWLGYIKSNHTIAGSNTPRSPDIHKAGMIAFKNVVVDGGGAYLRMDSAGQKFSLQQTNDSDPNVSGGTDLLISFRVSLAGNAITDGSVLVYLYDASIDPFDKDSYLTDKNGDPIVAVHTYKQGEPLGDLDLTAIVNAKGLKDFTCHVINSTNGFIELNDRFHGGTCLLVQDLSGKDKTGDALIQFELDTNDKLWYEDDGTTYALKSSLLSRLKAGKFVDKYEAFIQDTQGNAELRYSIGLDDTPIPCGKATKGHADVEVDPSVNKVVGSGASGGEGAIKFKADGNVDISTTVRLNNSTDANQTATFWWSTVAEDGTLTKIPESEKALPLLPKTFQQETVLPLFTMLVENGDRIALTAKASVGFGVFIQTNSDRYPLTETVATFKEIQPAP